jgi:tRNA1(Val) A37 N6-methylase TrmN6
MESTAFSSLRNADEAVAIPIGPLRRSLEAVSAFHGAAMRLDFCLTNPPFFDVDEETGPRADGQDRATMTQQEGK